MGEGDKRSERAAQHSGKAASEASGELAPHIARTTTLDDPLTTSLLAEVARRSRTIEVSPEQIAEATVIEPASSAATKPADSGDPADPV